MDFICLNGQFLASFHPVFTIQNRSFKWGDGIFETIKFCKGKILLEQLHFDRLFLSLQLLQITATENFSQSIIVEKITELAERNHCVDLARIRVAVFRNEDHTAGYSISAEPLSHEVNQWNQSGLSIGIYPFARKSMDAFSNLKTANFLPYIMAGIYAKEKSLDDVILLNASNKFCDSTKANIFLIRNKEFFTPALHQGCINGVMRNFLITALKTSGFRTHQQEITEEDLQNADEVFLTNAIFGMRWVRSFRNFIYDNKISQSIYEQIVSPIFVSG